MSYGGAGIQEGENVTTKGKGQRSTRDKKKFFSLIFDLNCVVAALIVDGLTLVLA